MTRHDERRGAARILTEFPLVLLDESGAILDDRALAHDLSDKGFRAETQADLARGQLVRFRLSLDERGEVRGRARIAWSEKTDLSRWAGAEFQGLSWSDRRRVRLITSPSGVDWNVIADKALVALVLLAATILVWKGLASPTWRQVFWEVAPKALAAIVAGLALREFLRPGR